MGDDEGNINDDMYLMHNLNYRQVPYYVGEFGAQGCYKLTASGIVAQNTDDAKTVAIPEEVLVPTVGFVQPVTADNMECGPGMSGFTSNHCSDGGDKETGADLPGVIGNTARVNPRVASVVGGEAIFNIIAAVFAATNFNCANILDAMFEINEGALIRNYDG